MGNRYKSILAGVARSTAKDIRSLQTQLPQHAVWKAKDGMLVAVIDGEEHELSFEDGDPITEVLLLFLNNTQAILTTLEQT